MKNFSGQSEKWEFRELGFECEKNEKTTPARGRCACARRCLMRKTEGSRGNGVLDEGEDASGFGGRTQHLDLLGWGGGRGCGQDLDGDGGVGVLADGLDGGAGPADEVRDTLGG